MAKVVVIYSGGMDSFTVLNKALSLGHEVYALSFNYGQKHSRELICAKKVCEAKGISHKLADITAISTLMQSSSLVSDDIDVPEGHYEAENMKSTVVPNRNMVLISLAIAYAVDIGAQSVWYGAHSGDHTIYPDCRPEFVEKMNQVSHLANFEVVDVFAPYLYQNKIDILRDGIEMGLDYGDSWTCYKGLEKACGLCGSCVERLEAFDTLGQVDPIEYSHLDK